MLKHDQSKKTTYIFTDGSALNNANEDLRLAGAACRISVEDIPIVSIGKFLKNNTNNYAELYAVNMSLSWVMNAEKYKANITKSIRFYIDSKYTLDIMTGTIQNISKNKKLIYTIKNKILELSKSGYEFEYVHVKAHTKTKDFLSKQNDFVDKLAKACAKNKKDVYVRHDRKK